MVSTYNEVKPQLVATTVQIEKLESGIEKVREESEELPRSRPRLDDPTADEVLASLASSHGHPYDDFTPENMPKGWFKGKVIPII